jgi:integrase
MVATKVATLPAGDHTDSVIRGLQLRVREKHSGTSRTWLLRYRWRDEHVRLVIGHYPGMSLADARALALELRKSLEDDGIDPRRARPRRRPTPAALPGSAAIVAPDDKHTVDFLVSEFVERYLRATRKRPEYAERILAHDVLSAWHGRDARSIKPREVIELLDGIAAHAPVMANRCASLLGQMFRFGIHRVIVDSSPVQLLYRPGGREKPRARALSDDELRAFLRDPLGCARYPRLAHVVILLLLTGQRRGELAAARWEHLDFDAKTWTIPDTNSKTGRGHVLPLSDWALEEFRALRRLAKRSPWVLPASDGVHHLDGMRMTRGVARCQERFKERGVEAFTLHDLRRTLRTGLSALKVEASIAERVLNHAQRGVAGTYDRFAYIDEKRDALDRWATHLRVLASAG